MIFVRIVMNVLPEKHKEMVQTLLSIMETLEKESGYINHGIFRDIVDINGFNLISEWETRKDLDRHMRSDRFSVLLGTKSLLFEPLSVQILKITC